MKYKNVLEGLIGLIGSVQYSAIFQAKLVPGL